MYDLLSIGAVSIDFYFKGESLTQSDDRFNLAIGGKYTPNFYFETIGGGGANVAIGVQKHAYRTGVVSKIGNNEFKHLIKSKLNENGVSDLYCRIEDGHYNLSTILLTDSGERTVIHYQTPHKKIVESQDDYKIFERTRAVFFGNLPDVSLEEKIRVLRYLNKNNIATFVNLGVTDCRRPKSELKELLDEVYILILNGHEFADLVKKNYDDINFKKDVIADHMDFYGGRLLIVTDGKKGSYGYYQGSVLNHEAIKPAKIVDTTGAGDGYTAGFISEYIKSHNLPKAMESGAEYAAKILTRVGAN